jgi:hypothetical protein
MCQVKCNTPQRLHQLEESWRLYDGAGFKSKAKETKPKLLLAKAIHKLNNPIVFKRPDFTVTLGSFPRYPLRKPNPKKPRSCRQWVYEVEPRIFRGNVPIPVLATALEAKDLGFKPYVWFVSSAAELNRFLDEKAKLDPALVAYPVVANEAGTEVVDKEFGILLGIWGADIEEINTALENVKHRRR